MGKVETKMYCFPVLGSIKHGGFCFRVVFINPFVVGFVSLSFSDVSLDELCNGLFCWVVWLSVLLVDAFMASDLPVDGMIEEQLDSFICWLLNPDRITSSVGRWEDDILRIQSFELIPQLLEDEGGSLCGLPPYGCFCGDLIDLVVDVKSEAFVGPCEFWSVIEGLGGTAYVAGLQQRPKKLACCNDVFPVARVTLPVSHAG
ncbi:hypothetical protein LIER_12719 [Lithospermum erythrorhizon]|uniref:Uncharacterized protein n=1 Tax=Lithospermum erythrorhizon TaxID=34254 RepID=A0AAV3PSU7_LITER